MTEEYTLVDILTDILISLVIGFLIGVIVGNSTGRDFIRSDAVKNNIATWTNDENGEAKFEWIKKLNLNANAVVKL